MGNFALNVGKNMESIIGTSVQLFRAWVKRKIQLNLFGLIFEFFSPNLNQTNLIMIGLA